MTYFGEDYYGLLFFRIPTALHECAHLGLIRLLHDKAWNLGLDHALVSICTTRYEPYNSVWKKCKQGDSGMRPDPPRDHQREFPSLVVECGNSESYPRLLEDRDWWFNNSPPGSFYGDVKVVITVKVDSRTRRLLIEQWHRGQDKTPDSVHYDPAEGPRKALV